MIRLKIFRQSSSLDSHEEKHPKTLGEQMKTKPLFIIAFLYLSPAFVFPQEPVKEKLLLPSGISLEYGIGSFAVTDEYISKEKYSGSLPYYGISWYKPHDNYVYRLSLNYRNSSEIKNNNVSADVHQFTLNQGFSYALPKFSLFDKDAYLYLGPSAELFFYFNKQNIAVSGFDYAQSFAALISGGVTSQLFYKFWNDFDIEANLDFSLLSFAFRMVDEEETDESSVKLLTIISGTNLNFNFGPRYYLFDNLSIKAAYLFHLTRIGSWEPLLSASDNVVFTLTYGF